MATAHGSSVSGRLHATPWLPSRLPRRPAQHRRLALPALPPGLADGSMSDVAAASGPQPAESFLLGLQQGLMQHPQLYILESLLVLVAAYAAAAWPDRPRGWCLSRLVTVGPSKVAGRGVFALLHIEAGTVIGSYPGRPRTPAAMAAKAAAAPGAKDYCFKTRSGLLLDPTDATGQLSSHPAPGLPWLPTDFTLACINEPPRGVGGTNVSVEDDPSDPNGLLCVAARDIQPGEELFMDYGLTYDRSSYRRADSAEDAQGQQQGAEQQRQQQQQRRCGKSRLPGPPTWHHRSRNPLAAQRVRVF